MPSRFLEISLRTLDAPIRICPLEICPVHKLENFLYKFVTSFIYDPFQYAKESISGIPIGTT